MTASGTVAADPGFAEDFFYTSLTFVCISTFSSAKIYHFGVLLGEPFKSKAAKRKKGNKNRRKLSQTGGKWLRNEKKLLHCETFYVLNFVIRAKVYTFTADIITIT
ncbi:MAG: hypothetical protein ACI30R_08725 [Sodaliphilus sp.]